MSLLTCHSNALAALLLCLQAVRIAVHANAQKHYLSCGVLACDE
jgi:hypothetical protein